MILENPCKSIESRMPEKRRRALDVSVSSVSRNAVWSHLQIRTRTLISHLRRPMRWLSPHAHMHYPSPIRDAGCGVRCGTVAVDCSTRRSLRTGPSWQEQQDVKAVGASRCHWGGEAAAGGFRGVCLGFWGRGDLGSSRRDWWCSIVLAVSRVRGFNSTSVSPGDAMFYIYNLAAAAGYLFSSVLTVLREGSKEAMIG